MKKYEQPQLKIEYLQREDVLTASGEKDFSGDKWISDPFINS